MVGYNVAVDSEHGRKGFEMSKYNQDPRTIKARFDSVCPETGKPIKRGDDCVYFPRHKKAYHVDSKSADDWSSQAVADAFCLGDSGW